MDLIGISVVEVVFGLLFCSASGFFIGGVSGIFFSYMLNIRPGGPAETRIMGVGAVLGIVAANLFGAYLLSNSADDVICEKLIRSSELVNIQLNDAEFSGTNKIDGDFVSGRLIDFKVGMNYGGHEFPLRIRRRTRAAIFELINQHNEVKEDNKEEELLSIVENNLKSKLGE